MTTTVCFFVHQIQLLRCKKGDRRLSEGDRAISTTFLTERGLTLTTGAPSKTYKRIENHTNNPIFNNVLDQESL